jgi:hypothetical protein
MEQDQSRRRRARPQSRRRVLGLEHLTVAWNLVEGGVGVVAAAFAGSVMLLGFSIDSFVESASGLIRRLAAEERVGGRGGRENRRAGAQAGGRLAVPARRVHRRRRRARALAPGQAGPEHHRYRPHGAVSRGHGLARAGEAPCGGLGSRALRADAFQTAACFWLSAITLADIGLNAFLGWWWADPVAALRLEDVRRERRDLSRGPRGPAT